MNVLIETSARHVHLSEEGLESLFGKGFSLEIKKELSQPNQYASHQRVELVGPKGAISNVIVLGPIRKETQVEVSLTDSRKLGLNCFIRSSGDIENTTGCQLVGPKGTVNLKRGVIIAKRHVHLDTKLAIENSLKDNQIVNVRIQTKERSLIFDDVIVRVSDDFFPAMHIDTDESNAAGLFEITYGKILV